MGHTIPNLRNILASDFANHMVYGIVLVTLTGTRDVDLAQNRRWLVERYLMPLTLGGKERFEQFCGRRLLESAGNFRTMMAGRLLKYARSVFNTATL